MALNKVIRCGGNNTYKIPHAGKDKIIRRMMEDIPPCLPCVARMTGQALDGEAITAFMRGQRARADYSPPPNISGRNLPAFLVGRLSHNQLTSRRTRETCEASLAGNHFPSARGASEVTAADSSPRGAAPPPEIDFVEWEEGDDEDAGGGHDGVRGRC